MRNHLFCVALVISATAFASDTLDVKTGLWEMTYTTATHGTLLPQSTLDKLTPEQRAKVQASMKAQQAEGPKPHTDQTCVTAEDLEKGAFRDEEGGECKYTSLTHTKTVQEESVQCSGAEGRRGTFKVEARDPEHIVARFSQEQSSGGVAVQITGKWLAASCPADIDD
jgi:hypothetical protein